MFISVVLPAPFSPSSARSSPFASVNEISSLASNGPKRLLIFLARGPVEFLRLNASHFEVMSRACLIPVERRRPHLGSMRSRPERRPRPRSRSARAGLRRRRALPERDGPVLSAIRGSGRFGPIQRHVECPDLIARFFRFNHLEHFGRDQRFGKHAIIAAMSHQAVFGIVSPGGLAGQVSAIAASSVGRKIHKHWHRRSWDIWAGSR